jgi:hypothetical protein
MKSPDAIAWFEELASWKEGGGNEITEWVAWMTEASSAIDSVFPVTHPVQVQWSATKGDGDIERLSGNGLRSLKGVLFAGLQLLKSGRLPSLLDGVRAETVVELIDQADDLLRAHALVPAVVLAGGALETHLRHLCDRHALLGALQGHGTIEKYRGVLDTARNAGTEIVSKGDAKQLSAWADDRNVAAHTPTEFTKNAAAVKLMIDGVRQFVERTK